MLILWSNSTLNELEFATPLIIKKFSKFLDRCPERYKIRLPALPDNRGKQCILYIYMYSPDMVILSHAYSMVKQYPK